MAILKQERFVCRDFNGAEAISGGGHMLPTRKYLFSNFKFAVVRAKKNRKNVMLDGIRYKLKDVKNM